MRALLSAAPLDDGHARVNDSMDRTQRQYLPVSIRPAGTVLHREGIKPDVVAVPTPDAIHAGKDEVLERGLGVLEGAPRR